MVKIADIDERHFSAWAALQSKVIQEVCTKLPPDRIYMLRSTGHRVTIDAYCEDGTVIVIVGGMYNQVSFERRVFGVDPSDLEECDLPSESEPVGAVLKDPKEVQDFLDEMRPAILAARARDEVAGRAAESPAVQSVEVKWNEFGNYEWRCPKCNTLVASTNAEPKSGDGLLCVDCKDPAPEIETSLATLIRLASEYQCPCTAHERDSGHLVGCEAPSLWEAAADARAAISGDPGTLSALKELVRLKDLKDLIEAQPNSELHVSRLAEYQRCKDKAWSYARIVLASSQHIN